MKQVRLGDTSTFVSEMSLGCMYFGSKIPEATSFGLLDRYTEAAGSFLDTANCYAFWVPGSQGDESEMTIGRWMHERRNRSSIFLATKVGARPDPERGGTTSVDKEGLSAAAIAAGLEGSLRRLGTDHVDLLYTHIPDFDVPLEETLGALDRLVREGMVLNVGCSNEPAWRIERARSICAGNGWHGFTCVQDRYTYLRPRPGAVLPQVCVNDDLLDYAARNRDLSLLAYSPLLGGCYSNGRGDIPPEYRTSDSAARMIALNKVAAETAASPNAVVLAWLMRSTPPLIPIVAASSEEQLLENLGAGGLRLTKGQLEALTSAVG